MRRLALIIPLNRKGQVLLQHRTADAPRKPDHWAFFGGHMELNEAPAEAARREFNEEIQLEIDDMQFFRRYLFVEEDSMVEKFFFMTLLDENPESLRAMQLEGDNLGYFGPGGLDGLKISADDRKVLDDFWA